jgi:formamidopyrimidine-DNA glycosylase
MPELPEVETVRAGLDAEITGRVVRSVTLHRPNLRYPFPDGLSAMVAGQRVDAVRRRAKYLLFDVGSHTLIGHLGMSGTYILREQGYTIQPHDHMVWEMEDGRDVVYHDPRRFGFLLHSDRREWESHPMLMPLGVEPFSDILTETYLAKILANRSSPIKAVLLDQHIIAGIGNIYACEALFRTRLHPTTPSHDCVSKAAELIVAIRATLGEAIASGGSTLRNYANTSGGSGYFQHSFAVYGRHGKPCLQCGQLLERIIQSGRSTFFCSFCQPK